MATTDRETFLVWLRDAYAFEKKLVPELEAHAGQAADHPAIRNKIQQHIGQTERHAETVHEMLHSLGSDTSVLKTLAGQVAGAALGMSTAVAGDKMVKNALAEFTMEHTEIASYTSLIAAAEYLGLTEIVPKLQAILAEEQAMADWLRTEIPRITAKYLAEQERAGSAA